MKISFRFALFVSTLVLCLNTVPLFASTQITIKAIGGNAESIKVKVADPVRSGTTLLSEAKLDASGAAKLNFNLTQAQFVGVNIGAKYCRLYLSPNEDLNILVDLTKPDAIPQFQGVGAANALYLAHSDQAFLNTLMPDGKRLDDTDIQLYLSQLDKLQSSLSEIHTIYKGSLSKELSTLFENDSKMYLLYLRQNRIRNERKSISSDLQKIKDYIPFDVALLNANPEPYGALLHYHFLDKLAITAKEIKERNSSQDLFKTAIEKIKEDSYPKEFKELLIAKTIAYSLQNGPTSITESLYHEFKQQYSASPYFPSVESRYNQWLPLAKGKTAPEIAGLTSDNKMLSTNEFKGKVIYVDVWATWCGPCRAEFPKAKELQKQFEGNDKVVFLNVSIDEDIQQWKKLLSDQRTPKGYHINQPNSKIPESIYQSYKISGIPRYILIDQEGKIVNVDATRPSSGKAADEIEALLSK
ncbi:TlpA family protein disulfide reductase [Runella sp.]|uniref:TlpA family protein disulfide reductase n=1 Tax=Runella sp. TaxID=1960881 RepID=UPI003D14539D